MLSLRKSRPWCQLLSAYLLVFLAVSANFAQEDPDPDSPTPVLISEPNSLRALAIAPDKANGANLGSRSILNPVFTPNERAVLYVTNLDLMPGEDATAFRVYVEDSRGRIYRFPVLDLRPFGGQEGVYALTVELRDELGFWEQPAADGDVLVNVAWRGLQSNRLRLGLGATGGALRDDAGAVPVPFPTKRVRNAQTPTVERVGYRHSGDRVRFLEQATFGPTPALDERIRRIGLRTWLAEQFDAAYPTNAYPNPELRSTNSGLVLPNGCGSSDVNSPIYNPNYAVCIRDYYNMYPVQNWFYKEAFYGDAQLKHRVAWALSQMWVVSGVDTQQSRHMIEYHKVLSRNAFGNYRTLMSEMTLNPAMGNYLDMIRSTRNNPNENYAREILQLFSVGLFMLNQNGTLQRDANNNPIETYDQADVNAFTKVFTGWATCESATTSICPNRSLQGPNYIDPLLLNQANHNLEAKTLLDYPNAVNRNIAANLNGNTEMQLALDNIYYHPNVAPYVSRFLIQHLVTSDPTPAYVGRIAAVFTANRTNPTQLKEVVKAILLDPEARGNVKTDANYGKLREPVQLATNVLRQFGVQSALGGAPSDGVFAGLVSPMGQNTFYSPTVFNYYPPDYIVPGPGLNGPEFAIMTTGTAIARANFMNTMVFNRLNVSAPNIPSGTSINLTAMQALAAADATSNRLLDELNVRMMHGTMTAQNRATILTAVNAVAATDPLTRAKTAIYLVATSSQFQVQR